MQLDFFFFFFWLANTKCSVYHTLPQLSVWGAAICHISAEIRVLFHRAWCVLIIHITAVTRGAELMKQACKSRNPPFIDWRAEFKTPQKDSALKPADAHSVYLLIHPCGASSLFVWLESWKRWKDLCSICFPNQTNKLCEASPSIIILL